MTEAAIRAAAPQDPPPVPVHDARHLMAGGRLACIVLDGTAYVLRLTRQGKLILTK